MKKLLAISIVLVFLGALILTSSYTNAQRQQQRRTQQPGDARANPALMIRRLMALEESWAYMSFALKVDDKPVTDEQLVEARKQYQKAWDATEGLAKRVTDKELILREARTKVREIQKNLNTEIELILTEKQNAKFRTWFKEYNRRRTRERTRTPTPQRTGPREGGTPRPPR